MLFTDHELIPKTLEKPVSKLSTSLFFLSFQGDRVGLKCKNLLVLGKLC